LEVLDMKQIVESPRLGRNVDSHGGGQIGGERIEGPRPGAAIHHATVFGQEAHFVRI
jgi:hypothetical protein